jgi:uncharacterized membrane protein YfhO
MHLPDAGLDAPIRAANGVFRAVPVPAGAREVTFSYRPASVVAGAAISVLALLAIAVLALRPTWRRDPRRPRRAPRSPASA